jgi:hypothetical protein
MDARKKREERKENSVVLCVFSVVLCGGDLTAIDAKKNSNHFMPGDWDIFNIHSYAPFFGKIVIAPVAKVL